MLESGTSARYSRALVLAGLLALSVVGCQGETTDAKSSGEPSETKQTLGLLEGLISNCNDTLEKLAGRKEDYASTGDVRGEQLMGEAAGNVKDI